MKEPEIIPTAELSALRSTAFASGGQALVKHYAAGEYFLRGALRNCSAGHDPDVCKTLVCSKDSRRRWKDCSYRMFRRVEDGPP